MQIYGTFIGQLIPAGWFFFLPPLFQAPRLVRHIPDSNQVHKACVSAAVAWQGMDVQDADMGCLRYLSMAHHALVFGASGILGWSVVDQILKNYPEKGTFTKVTALCNRPLREENAFWPVGGPGKPSLQIVDGIDLTSGTMAEVRETLKSRIPDIESVTHIYYFAYLFDPDFTAESKINLGMLQGGFVAAESLAPKLQYVILPTGTKGYGIHVPRRPFEAPFTEDMSDVPHPWHDELFYYVLHKELDSLQQGKSWKFAEIRCGPVLGFVPHKNPYNLPGIYMNFLSVYKFLQEQGHPDAKSKEVPFPAPPPSYNTLFNDGGQDIFAKFSIYLCVNPEVAGNSELYNIGDAAKPVSMADRWPYICSLFDLVGVPPLEKSDPAFVLPVSFVGSHANAVAELNKAKGYELQEIGLDTGLEGWMEHFTFDHHLSLDKAKTAGFEEELSFQDSWRIVFDRYHRAHRCYYGNGK
ncbi:hypothetical protein JX266_001633 [Neoarthrinium moseri]|nr:hypothetical protein JX266_001633 [Neoarthrinium moseri]